MHGWQQLPGFGCVTEAYLAADRRLRMRADLRSVEPVAKCEPDTETIIFSRWALQEKAREPLMLSHPHGAFHTFSPSRQPRGRKRKKTPLGTTVGSRKTKWAGKTVCLPLSVCQSRWQYMCLLDVASVSVSMSVVRSGAVKAVSVCQFTSIFRAEQLFRGRRIFVNPETKIKSTLTVSSKPDPKQAFFLLYLPQPGFWHQDAQEHEGSCSWEAPGNPWLVFTPDMACR